MNDSDRFLELASAYEACSRAALHNLGVLKERLRKNALLRAFSKSQLDNLKPVDLTTVRGLLAGDQSGKKASLVFGHFNEEMSFYPSITERMLNVHGVANLINAILQTRKVHSERDLVVHLQDALLDFSFLGWTFLFCHQKARLPAGRMDPGRNEGKEAIYRSYVDSFRTEVKELGPACIDIDHLNAKITKYEFRDYSWFTYEARDDSKVVNDYYLPKGFWEPYLAAAARRQAEAMDPRAR